MALTLGFDTDRPAARSHCTRYIDWATFQLLWGPASGVFGKSSASNISSSGLGLSRASLYVVADLECFPMCAVLL